ncbi:MAG: tRNA pseudouridine(55) synthase TruB [Halobacteriovorax sp.]|nr:tRNA pseudouridine(55) synthase TruB [Halobacteriovorax sp.]
MNEQELKDYKKGPTFGPFIFLIDKKEGETSFDVIRKFKKIFGKKRLGKIGHFGTLDPFATGLLMIGIGGSTRLNQYIDDYSKEYIATGILGVRSPTGDLTCNEEDLIHSEISETITKEDVIKALESFIGPYEQAPHSYSAAKHEGKKLYEWARAGVEIKKDKVLRHIHDIELLKFDKFELTFRVVVSHGTYIRVLMEDIAGKLHTIGVLKSLRRSKVGHMTVENTLSSGDISVENAPVLLEKALGVQSLLDIEKIDLGKVDNSRYNQGQRIRTKLMDGMYWIVEKNYIYGLGSVKEGLLSSLVNFQPPAMTSLIDADQ